MPRKKNYKKRKKLSKKEFLKGFESKSFLGSAYPSLRDCSQVMDERVGTHLRKQYKDL